VRLDRPEVVEVEVCGGELRERIEATCELVVGQVVDQRHGFGAMRLPALAAATAVVVLRFLPAREPVGADIALRPLAD